MLFKYRLDPAVLGVDFFVRIHLLDRENDGNAPHHSGQEYVLTGPEATSAPRIWNVIGAR
jgi:hypothetical protein